MIVPVKKARVIVLKDEVAYVIQALQKHALLMLNQKDKPSIQTKQQRLDHVKHLITQLKPLKTKESFFEYHQLTYDELMNNENEKSELVDKVYNLYTQFQETKEQVKSLESYLARYQSFKKLEMNPNTMKEAKYAKFHTGFISDEKKDDFLGMLKDLEVPYETFDLASEGQAVLFVTYIDDDKSVMDKVNGFNFQTLDLPDVDERLDLDYEKASNDKLALESLIKDYQTSLEEVANDMSQIYAYADYLKAVIEQSLVDVKETKSTSYIEGWVRTDEIDKLKEVLGEITSHYELELADPNEQDNPPTALKNNKFVSQFETITDMFSTPNPNELDPNPVMSIWYWIIFGIMMGDVGYGLIMVVMSFLFIKYKKPKGGLSQLVHIFFYTGFTTIVAGVLFGSLFGFSVDFLGVVGNLFNQDWTSTLIEPVSNPIPMLIFSMAFGILHIFNGLIFKLVLLIKRKDYMSAFADVSSWMLVLAGVSVYVIGMVLKGDIKDIVSLIGVIMAILGALIILFFAGREKSNIFGRFFGGLGALYGASGYLSDVLSYSRILALSLSSAVIASTMNILADMVSGGFVGIILGLVIYAVGHIFNLVMGLLSAYVHDGRLQYIEFFGKFYEGGGYRFSPFQIETQYINEIIYEEKGNK